MKQKYSMYIVIPGLIQEAVVKNLLLRLLLRDVLMANESKTEIYKNIHNIPFYLYIDNLTC